MAIASSFTRSILRSSPLRNAAAKLTTESKAARSPFSPFRLRSQKPLGNRIFRSPVEMSCCVESLMPFHTVTASALLTSMLSVSRVGCGWLPEGHDDTR